MVKCIFSLGIINKKLIAPLLTTISYAINALYFKYFPGDDVDQYFYNFGVSIGELIIFFIPYIFKYRNYYKNKNAKKKKCTKNNIFDYFFLILLYLLKKFCVFFEENFYDSSSDSLCTMEAFEIIIIFLITKFFMKYKYYIHHTISLIIFLILSIRMDIILENFKLLTISSMLFLIIYSIIEAFYYCYMKYMIYEKYHSIYNMIFLCGVVEFFSNLIIFGIMFIIRFKYNNNDILSSLDKYDKSKIGHIAFTIFVGLIIDGLFNSILEFQTINLFNPNFIFVCYEISKIANILIYIEDLFDLLIIIPYIFQIIILLFYIEIFEFNFCDLNKNTKKNILLREREEIIIDGEKKEDILVELKEGYFVVNKENESEADGKSALLPEEEEPDEK